jgi:hypothetical protein
MKNTTVPARPASPARKALAEQLANIAELRARLAAPAARSGPQPEDERKTGVERPAEQARLQQLLSEAIGQRAELVANVLVEDELPRRIRAYQRLVLEVNAAWNDILAYDDAMRRRYPARASIFNTAGPHAHTIVAPSTDNSPVPVLPIHSRKLFAAASRATDQFVELLASDAEARFGGS